MGDVINFPGFGGSREGGDTDFPAGDSPPDPIDPHNMLREEDGITQEQFEGAAFCAIEVLEGTAGVVPHRETRELREDLVETYTASQVVTMLAEATSTDWQKRPELYQALAFRFHIITQQERE